jgi:hypothetical protein
MLRAARIAAGGPAHQKWRPAEVKNRGEKSDHFDFLEWEKGREARRGRWGRPVGTITRCRNDVGTTQGMGII